MKSIIEKLGRSFSKILLPILFKIFFFFKINRRAINFFSEKSFFANNNHNFIDLIDLLLNQEKIIALDVGAQGGFNSDYFISKKYNHFFEPILVEPIKEAVEELKKKNKHVIENALWSSQAKKKIYILGNRLGSSSMYEPNPIFFDLHKIKKKDYQNYKVTKEIEVNCETLNDSLSALKINKLDYLKIDTQGAELEILKSIGNYRPLLIRIESHVHSMYKNVPSWNELLDHLYKLNYLVIDWKGIGSHATRIPAEMDMVFIPNFNNEIGKKLILKNENKFVSLMLMFGQISLLKIISDNNNFKSSNKINNLEDFFFH
jgi:FkbM family methyltransferase